MEPDAERVIGFWLDEVGTEGWYKPDEAIDSAIRERFLPLWQRGAAGGLARWLAQPRGVLALLIVLDQFPRNMFRGTAEAYRTDTRARAAAKLALHRGLDRAVAEPGRQFFYLPLMHSESLADQDRCVRLVHLRLPGTGAENLGHAGRHRAVIRRFGRFPSRNAALGRRDTGAERRYRAEGGYMG